METMELYHIHKKNKYDKKWNVGNTLVVSEKFENDMFRRYNNFGTTVPVDYGDCVQYNLYHNLVISVLNDNSISLSDLNLLRTLLAQGYNISYYANMFKREQALEQSRLDNCPNLPSRLHSVYLADEDGKYYWNQIIDLNDESFDVYRVEATGNIFKTNEDLIPDESLSYIDAYNVSQRYWKPKFKNTSQEKNEYLVQGNIKILEKVKNN